MVMIGGIASFSFANNSINEKDLPKDQDQPCDGYGGVVTIHVTVNCDGDGTPEVQGTIKTCGDQATALIEHYQSLCD